MSEVSLLLTKEKFPQWFERCSPWKARDVENQGERKGHRRESLSTDGLRNELLLEDNALLDGDDDCNRLDLHSFHPYLQLLQ